MSNNISKYHTCKNCGYIIDTRIIKYCPINSCLTIVEENEPSI